MSSGGTMSDDLQIGEKFEWIDASGFGVSRGDICRVTGGNGISAKMFNETTGKDLGDGWRPATYGFMWRRLPRESTPMVEEIRAAKIHASNQSHAKGTWCRSLPASDTVAYQWTQATCLNCLRAGAKDGAVYAIRRLAELEAATPPPSKTIEQRRAGLKPGEVIKDPVLCTVGMRLGWKYPEQSESKRRGCTVTAETNREGVPVRWDETHVGLGLLSHECFQKGGVAFLGMTGEGVSYPRREPREGAPALTPAPRLTFKPHPRCTKLKPEAHTSFCLVCESLIADDQAVRTAVADLRRAKPFQHGTYEPSPTGLGGMIGGMNVWRPGR